MKDKEVIEPPSKDWGFYTEESDKEIIYAKIK